MAYYMVQSMQAGAGPKITYYRKQSVEHPSHAETGSFTQAAVSHYLSLYANAGAQIEKGKFRSKEGVPTGENTQLI